MPRALTIQRVVVPAGERDRYLAGLPARRTLFRDERCNFWVFEEAEVRGAFLEFTEAGSGEQLAAALESATGTRVGPSGPSRLPVYIEVPLD